MQRKPPQQFLAIIFFVLQALTDVHTLKESLDLVLQLHGNSNAAGKWSEPLLTEPVEWNYLWGTMYQPNVLNGLLLSFVDKDFLVF